MFATKQTARKSTGGTVGPYTLAGHQAEDEDEDLGESDGDEEEDEEDEVRPAATARHTCLLCHHIAVPLQKFTLLIVVIHLLAHRAVVHSTTVHGSCCALACRD